MARRGAVPPGRSPSSPPRADRWFGRVTLASGLAALLLLALVGLFLLLRSHEAISVTGVVRFLTRVEWRTDVSPPQIGVLGLLTGTVLVALIAITIAVPLGIMRRAVHHRVRLGPEPRRYLTALVDLLAAIPSLLFGIWGFLFLADQIVPLSAWLDRPLRVDPVLRHRARTPTSPARCSSPASSCR